MHPGGVAFYLKRMTIGITLPTIIHEVLAGSPIKWSNYLTKIPIRSICLNGLSYTL